MENVRLTVQTHCRTGHKIITWLVKYAADILNKFDVGVDGTTAHEKIKRKKFHGDVVEFGRRVMYKILRKLGVDCGGEASPQNLAWEERCPMNILLW